MVLASSSSQSKCHTIQLTSLTSTTIQSLPKSAQHIIRDLETLKGRINLNRIKWCIVDPQELRQGEGPLCIHNLDESCPDLLVSYDRSCVIIEVKEPEEVKDIYEASDYVETAIRQLKGRCSQIVQEECNCNVKGRLIYLRSRKVGKGKIVESLRKIAKNEGCLIVFNDRELQSILYKLLRCEKL